jgi:hypothetical protein
MAKYAAYQPATDGHAVVIEYEVHGTILATGVTYNNRFCSIIKIEKRKIACWQGGGFAKCRPCRV